MIDKATQAQSASTSGISDVLHGDLHPAFPFIRLFSVQKAEISLLWLLHGSQSNSQRRKGQNGKLISIVLLLRLEEKVCSVTKEDENDCETEYRKWSKIFLSWEELD